MAALTRVDRRVRVLDPTPLALLWVQAVTIGIMTIALTALLAGFGRAELSTASTVCVLAPLVAYGCWSVAKLVRRLRRPALADLRVDDRGISLRGHLRSRRGAIRSVEYVPASANVPAPRLRIAGRFRSTTLECTSDEDARVVRDALAYAPEDRSVSFTFFPTWTPILAAAVGVLGGAGSLGQYWLELSAQSPFSTGTWIRLAVAMGPALGLGLLANLIFLRRRVKVELGLDGLRVRSGAHERFVPFAEVEWIRPASARVLSFRERGGKEERWYHFMGVDAFLQRFREATERLSVSESAAPPVLLDQASVGDYRRSAYPTDVLLRVVEAADQDVKVRVTAADALVRTGISGLGRAERDRVRSVAATTASAELRDRLEELSTPEDVRVRRA